MTTQKHRVNPLKLFGDQKGLVLQSNIDQYKISEIVGFGTFGIVVMAQNNSGEVVALKRVVQDHRYKNRELPIMEVLKHPNVLELKDSFFTKIPAIKDDHILNIVMDYLPYNLYQVLTERKLEETQIRSFSFQLARALTYIHSYGICHRDIKPQNVLINMETGLLKLCDFGSAKQLDPKGTNISYICSRYYRAPELIFDCTRYSTSIDIWAYGCVVAEMVMRNPFFRGESSADQLNKIMRVIGSPTTEEILSMNSKSIHTRIPKVNGFGIEAAMSIYFTPSNCVDLLKDVLKYNPFNRPTGMELIAHVFHKDVRKGIDFTQRELEEAKRRCVIITE